MKKQISLHVKCPHCRKSLMDEEKLLNGQPSIRLNIVTPEERGVIYLCSIYECHDHETNLDIKKNTVVDFYCPHCNKELLVNEECKVCGAPMVTFVLKVGGRVSICSREGCVNHYIAFQDLSAELSKFYQEYEP
jgi:ssDNA-binding Zn-finger/Zn-ribbon topoisomerase 1